MNLNILTPRKALKKAFLKVKPNRTEIESFKQNLIILIDHINEAETEEFHKNLVSTFLKDTYYKDNHFINTKGRNDLVIHNGKDAKSPVGVIIETKNPTNKAEMLKTDNINTKAFQELVLYYLRERITGKNLDVKCLIATNIYEWFVFDAQLFDELFAHNKTFVKQFNDFEENRLVVHKTESFYKEIAEPFINEIKTEITFTHFDIRDFNSIIRNADKQDDSKLISLYKLLSPEHLLKLPFVNDSNSLDKRFYSELLHIIGLTETKEGSKKLIERKKEGERNAGSLIENAIIQLDSLDKISRLEKPYRFGETSKERLFNVALELAITWVNRILFLKLLEAQLISYHKGDKSYSFLNIEKVKNYDDLNNLFFQVLARVPAERNDEVKKAFAKVPYLNSSLFEPTPIEHSFLFISQLSNEKLPILSTTVLKDSTGKKRTGDIDSLEYFFEFLDAYDFTSEGQEEIQEDKKTLINASVLGLIFEKINGYKEGSFFTPSFITMYMCRETIRRAVIQKFNEVKGWDCKTIDDLYNNIDDNAEANRIINSIKICDPAVGSGHFLVSALNEIIAIKSELHVLLDRNGKRLKEYHVEVENDELMITDEDGEFFEYNPHNPESQRVQETLFHEKQTIIESCLFGVDINPNSVKICRLRLWIELLKNAYYKTSTALSGFQTPTELELETLPNIDINIKCGNSLISRYALDADIKAALKRSKWSIDSYRIAVMTYRNAQTKDEKRAMERLINQIKSDFESEVAANDKRLIKLSKAKGELLTLTTQTTLFDRTMAEKATWDKQVKALTETIKNLETELDEIRNNKIYENAFEWRFEFPEVLNDDGDFVGFDVVIGNPPYMIVFDEKMKSFLEQSYPEFKRNNDLYIAFFKLGFSILRENANFSFITPNTFIKGEYFKPIREFLSEQKQIIELIDFGNILIFEGVNVFCAVTSANNKLPSKKWVLKTDLEKEKGFIEANTSDFILKNAIISRLDKLEKFDKYFLIKDVGFNYWSEGRGKVRGGSIGNRVFYNSEKENINDIPFIKGGDIQKYSISFSNNYLRHNWKTYLNENDTFRFNQELMECVPKIIYRQTSNKIIAAIDFDKKFNDKTVHILVNKDNYSFDLRAILALMNSTLINYFFQSFKEEEGRAFAQVKTIDIKNLPFNIPNADIQIKLASLVDQILNKKSQDNSSDTTDLENKIDQLVYQLYGLTEEEIKIVESSIS